MLEIKVPSTEQWDEVNQEFIYTKEQILRLEHSLVSLSKWESKWCRPFLTPEEKTLEETIDYVRCMTLTQNVDPNIYYCLSEENIRNINDYIKAPMTATTFSNFQNGNGNGGRGETVTAELIYYWMIAFNIPMECQKWHLNRLLTLIRVCSIKSSPPRKMSQREVMSRNSALNEARRQKLHSKG